jgi:hypothetical protein
MKRPHFWRKTGILALVVVALFLLSVVMPIDVVASPAVAHGSEPTAETPGSTIASSAAKTSKAVSPAHATPSSVSPHPGTLEVYEIAPSGQITLDPSVAYDTVDYEPILNVYQTLIAYNGTSTSNFVPELSTCVPGANDGVLSTASVSCQAVYGQTLITDNSAGEPQFWTFPIDSAARFYDGSTGVSWPVYPSDVMFTLARTMGFADLPGPGVLNGWIVSQSLLPLGNPKWDGAFHYPYNNTPQNILGSMLVNDSRYCPASALAQNGCITFDANGEGTDWPYFLELVADALGSGIEPCGWFTAMGANVPGFLVHKAAFGDGPCLLPGGSTNTSQAGFQSYLTSLDPTAWDVFEELAYNHPAVQQGVQFSEVGSGPYALVGDGSGYALRANPAYNQPTDCQGIGGGCEPIAGTYPNAVVVTYESTYTMGIEEMNAGYADFASYQPTAASCGLPCEGNGDFGFLHAPTLSINALAYNLAFNVTEEQSVDPYPGLLNVPSDFFASNTVRSLLNRAWPYTTVENTLWTVDGIQHGTNFGGAIPKGMGDDYPSNISWPYLGGNPGTNTSVNSAAWWWTQGTTLSSPYYDAELAACTVSTPCRFPIVGELGAPTIDAAVAEFIVQIENITGKALQPYTFDPSPPGLVQYPPSGNPYMDLNIGWAPDYPDPTDYMAAMYYANGTYTLGDTLYQTLENQANTQFWGSSCGHDSGSWSDLVYWANYASTNSGPIPSSCQGPAYGSMLTWMTTAASLPVGAYRTLIYNEVEHIENQLGFYLWFSQSAEVESYASWVSNATINVNVMIGGGGDQTWFLWGYVPVAPPKPGGNSTTTNNVPSWAYAAIGVLAVLVVIFLIAMLVLLARRRPPTMSSPQTWSPGQTPETKGEGGSPPQSP